jgi:Tfp pilus assembly protein PilO
VSKQRRFWLGLTCSAALLAAGLGYLIYSQYESIELARTEVQSLHDSIATARQTLTGTAQLEREVIVLRETEEAIKELLPDEQGVNDFVRKLQDFEQESQVRITSLKKKPQEAASRKKSKDDFDKVQYQLTFEADAFQMLTFLDSIESHSRFMSVPAFKLQAASRRDVVESGIAAHKVQLDVETYVYEPQTEFKPIKIEGYARKRELLLGEISRRRQALSILDYTYRGKRGRRDPWVDPRMPANVEDATSLTVQEQNAIVDELVAAAEAVGKLWENVRAAENVVKEMTLRAELEQRMSELETELRRVRDEGAIRYPPTERRLTLEVDDRLALVRKQIGEIEGGRGPALEALTKLHEAMTSHLAAGEHDMALAAFGTVENRLDIAASDPARKPWVEKLRQLEAQALILQEFELLKINITGVAIMENRPPVALINGRALGEGDSVDEHLIIRGIRPGEIEFIYKGVILIRRF